MKKMTFLACAALLTSMIVFTGCNNDKNNPEKAPSVTTDIAISLPTQVGGDAVRHMPSATVQQNGVTDFATNGMKSITLIPFGPSAKVTTASVRNGANLNLGSITHNEYTKSKGRTKLFENQNVPVGTSAFLFYAESGATGTNWQIGKLTGAIDNEPAQINFALSSILVANSIDIASDEAYTKMIAYLNSIANVQDSVGGKLWKEYVAADNLGYYELFQAYSTTHVLSSFGIQRMMTDLYKNLMLNAAADSLAKNLKAAIAKSGYATVDGSGNVTLDASMQNMPKKYGLPDGAIAVSYNTSTKVFESDVDAASQFGGTTAAPLARYAYAPSLWYYANSKIKTSNTSEKEHYDNGKSWAAILAEYANDDASVNSKTRSIAIKDTIQYAVGRLAVKVQTKENDYLIDNDPVPANNHVANPAGGYQITAVLIGGQKNVGFDFTPETYAGSDPGAFAIYDSIMTNPMYTSTGSYSAVNYTLVLESEEGASKDVYVAIELINSSAKDFYGIDGIVPVGGKFYLVGKLASASSTVLDASNNPIQRVFIQDYTTTAAFKIADLTKAYNTIPDLRAPALEIGMSVDLTWQEGTTYVVEL